MSDAQPQDRTDAEKIAPPPPGAPDPLGRGARDPTQIPLRGWWAVIRRVAREAVSDRISLVAAGCAFYAMLALFPALTMLIFIYGLAFDVATVEPQLYLIRQFLPEPAYELISERIHQLVTNRTGSLQIGLAISLFITVWSSMSGTKAMLSALNLAYEETEKRSFLRFNLTAFGITLGAVLASVVGLSAVVALPAVLAVLGVPDADRRWFRTIALLALFVFVMVALAVLYRFGPSRRAARWHWVTVGSVFAAVGWAAASWLFSLYVSEIGGYDVTYGPLGAVVGLMMWFWVSVFVILIGAELNAELEMQTTRDTTDPPDAPMGRRGAYVADNVAIE